MIPLQREKLLAAPFAMTLDFNQSPIQAGLGGSPWHVAVASLCLVRVRRNRRVIQELFERWPTPSTAACSDTSLESLLQPLGLHRQRARQIQNLSRRWDADTWNDLRDLPGVGRYVADAVGLFCFGCTDLESGDETLRRYAGGGPCGCRHHRGASDEVARSTVPLLGVPGAAQPADVVLQEAGEAQGVAR